MSAWLLSDTLFLQPASIVKQASQHIATAPSHETLYGRQDNTPHFNPRVLQCHCQIVVRQAAGTATLRLSNKTGSVPNSHPPTLGFRILLCGPSRICGNPRANLGDPVQTQSTCPMANKPQMKAEPGLRAASVRACGAKQQSTSSCPCIRPPQATSYQPKPTLRLHNCM